MAIYKQVNERVLLPYHYLATNGHEARHDTDDSELTVDEAGNPRVAFAELEKRNGRIIYTDGADLNLLTEDESAKAFYASDPASVTRMVNHSAIVQVDRSAAPQEDSEEAQEEAREVNASTAARREASNSGVDLTEVEGTGSGGQITVGDVRKAAEDSDSDLRTYEEE